MKCWSTLLLCLVVAAPIRCTPEGSRTNMPPQGRDAATPDRIGARKDTGVLIDVGPDVGFMDVAAPDAAPLSDRDNDGIPDAEDPMADTPNTQLFLDSFETRKPEWRFTSSEMTVNTANSVLEYMPRRLMGLSREAWIGVQPTWFDKYIRGMFRVLRVGDATSAGTGRTGILAHVLSVAPRRYLFCGIDLKQQKVFISEHTGGAAAGRDLVTEDAPIPTGEWVLITFDLERSSARCTASGVTARATSSMLTSGSIGVRTLDATLEVDWIEAYSR